MTTRQPPGQVPGRQPRGVVSGPLEAVEGSPARGTLADPQGGFPPASGQLSQSGSLLTAIYDQLSHRFAGGRRPDLNLVNPVTGEPIEVDTEGLLPEDIEAMLPTAEQWFDPVMFRDPERFDLSAIPKTASGGAGREGEGLDWFRSGQAPSNYANRNHPLYQARAEFISKHVAPTIADLFPGMKVTGQGYYRPPGGGGGQAKNSDHQSAGALDVFGTPEEMAALRNWAVNQPWVSFVRCNSPYHYDHVHISVDLGWVAENYYGGKTPPPVDSSTVAEADQARRTTAAPDVAGVRVL